MNTTRKNNPSLILLLIAIITHIGLTSCSQEATQKSEVKEAPKQVKKISVAGFKIGTNSIERSITATGSLIAYESVEIRPERSGMLTMLDMNEASFIQKGKIIGRIDDAELQAQKKRLLINLDLAEKEVERGKELLKIQGISKEEMDRLVNRVDDIQAEIAILDVQIEKSIIRTPFSGFLGLRQVSKGAYITPSNIIVTLQQLSPIKLEFEVPERYLSDVKRGQLVSFTIVGANKIFQGKVYAIDPEISPTTRTFKVRADVSNKDNILKPGQFAKVTLVTGINKDAILIPTDAVIPVLDGKQVYVLKKDRAIATSIETGDRRASNVEILAGLNIGDTIIVSGLLSLSDGIPVSVNQLVESQNPTE